MYPQERGGGPPFVIHFALKEPRCCSFSMDIARIIVVSRRIWWREPSSKFQSQLLDYEDNWDLRANRGEVTYSSLPLLDPSIVVWLLTQNISRSLVREVTSYSPLISQRNFSSITCVTFKTSAIAIRASSWVRVSNLFRAASISLLPRSRFRYFPNNVSCKIRITKIQAINSLRRPCLISVVAMESIEITSTMIFTISSVISWLGETSL